MGSSESKEQEVEYNLLKFQVEEWDGNDESQIKQIESFHRSIARRSMGSGLISSSSRTGELTTTYQDPESYLLAGSVDTQKNQLLLPPKLAKAVAKQQKDKRTREESKREDSPQALMRFDDAEGRVSKHDQSTDHGSFMLNLPIKTNYMEN